MNVYEVTPSYRRLSKLKVLSKEARLRLKWFDYYYAHGENARLTCRHFGIAPQTFYRWKKRVSPRDLGSLEERTRRPRYVMQPEYRPELVEAVRVLREQYPRWGKDKLVMLLREAGFVTSTSTVGPRTGLTQGAGTAARASMQRNLGAETAPEEAVRSQETKGVRGSGSWRHRAA